MGSRIVKIELTQDEVSFIVENALTSYWNECNNSLQRKDLGDIERGQLDKCRDKAKKISFKLDLLNF